MSTHNGESHFDPNKQRKTSMKHTQLRNDRLLFAFNPILVRFYANESSNWLIKLRRVDERDSHCVCIYYKMSDQQSEEPVNEKKRKKNQQTGLSSVFLLFKQANNKNVCNYFVAVTKQIQTHSRTESNAKKGCQTVCTRIDVSFFRTA